VSFLIWVLQGCDALPRLRRDTSRGLIPQINSIARKKANCFGFTINVSIATPAPATTAASK
ncbi:unnamed protein product, partial [Tenebrio molitor]